MKRNYLRLLYLGIGFILLVIFLIVKNQWLIFFPQKINQPFTSLKSKIVKEIDITDGVNTTILNNKNNQWFITKDGYEYPADIEKVNKIITEFVTLTKNEIASTNKNRHTDLGIINSKILLKTADKNYELYLGKNYSSNKNYLRIGNENEVFIAPGFSEISLSDDFRDLKTNLITNEKNVSGINITYDYLDINLQKKGNEWLLGDKKAITERVDFLINDLKTLKSNDIFSIKSLENQLNFPELTINIKENNKQTTAEFFSKDKDNYYLRSTNLNYIYQIPNAYVSSLKKTEKDFIE